MSLEEFRENLKSVTKTEKTDISAAKDFANKASRINGLQILGKKNHLFLKPHSPEPKHPYH